MRPERLVLLTGAAGNIGRGFRDEYWRRYRDCYRLRLGVRQADFRDDRVDDVAVFSIEDAEGTLAAMRGVDTVVHLAGNADWQASFDALVGPNLIGVSRVFEAAHLAGVRRVIFASSVHAIMGYPVDHQAHAHDPPRPDTLYGACKVYGEALCAVYAHMHGMSCLAIRIGAYVPAEAGDRVACTDNPQALDIAISQRDMAQLIHRCILAPDDVRYMVLNGLSDNRFKRMDLEDARALGYRPEDDAFRWSEKVRFGPEKKV